MPTSYYSQIPAVIEAIIDAKPTTLLEIGIGCGKYGVLAREYLDVWNEYARPWGEKHTTIVGIEIHRQYSDSPAWAAYDAVHIGDARTMLAGLGRFDTILMVDVFEHFEREEGMEFLKRLVAQCDNLIIAVPAGFFPTIEVWDNPHEIHRTGWTLEDFRSVGDVTVWREADSFVVTIRG
jgi:hypothetical protein